VKPTLFILAAFLFACGSSSSPDASVDGGGRDGASGPCAADNDCEDGLFCTEHRCRPGEGDARGCVSIGSPCEVTEMCVESARECRAVDCTDPDRDGDGRDAIACGGDDCDDEDAARYPSNAEVCDAEGHDEDCVDATLGGVDADGDGHTPSECCFGTTCGGDCDEADPNVNAAAGEACNAIDDDCDGATDGITAFCPFGTCLDTRCRASSWARTFGGGSGGEYVLSLDTDADGNIYVLVVVASDDGFTLGGDFIGSGMHVIAHSASGAYLWHHRLGSARVFDPTAFFFESFSAVLVGPAGEIVATKVSYDPDSFEFSTDLVWIDPDDGTELRREAHVPEAPWTHSMIMRVAAVPAGLVFYALLFDGEAGGTLLERRNWDGSLAGSRTFDFLFAAPRLAAQPDRVVLASGLDDPRDIDGVSVAAGPAIFWFDSSFTLSSTTPLPETIELIDIALSRDGDLAAAGTQSGAATLPWGETWSYTSGEPGFAFALDRSGEHLWTQRHTNASYAFTEFDDRGGVTVGGSFTGTFNMGLGIWAATGDCDAFVATLDRDDGMASDGRSISGTACESVSGVAVDAFGGIILTGIFTDRITLADMTFASSFVGRPDVFLTRSAE
jgi:hypothetical protein